MKTTLPVLLLCSLFAISGCNIVNPKEEIPTYIQIDSVQLISDAPATHGSVSQKITDVWVYYNLQLLGAYELPARVPVLAAGKGQLQVIAGIWDNGLSGTRAKYPFMTVDTFSFDSKPAETVFHTPQFKYRTNNTPPITYFVEGFEQGNSFTKRNGDTTFTKTNNPAEVYEESWASKVELHDTVNTFESITTQDFLLPPNKECYMELNYKSDIPFMVRVEMLYQSTYLTSDVIGLNSKDGWTKVYINLKGFASTYQNAKFKIILKGELPDGSSSSKTIIDNFKILYYN
ncbi:MAG: hypothetical protein IT257_01725 [Chitinophagaceae bacterium]|nr:hypothetical protein [Chitinophagaceae bacterium]